MSAVRVTIWNEYVAEKILPEAAAVYPRGMHEALAAPLRDEGFDVRTATFDEPQHGLAAEVLAATDVLLWWGHRRHRDVQDDVVDEVHRRVTEDGMGLVALHSAHYSKIFKRLMGTSCSLSWRDEGELERVWVIAPGHPIAAGLPPSFDIPRSEMYGEHFDIPEPDQLVLASWFAGGEVFRSGCCFYRGRGRIFYFSPGHETFPIYTQPEVHTVLRNAVRWAAPVGGPAPAFGERAVAQPSPAQPGTVER